MSAYPAFPFGGVGDPFGNGAGAEGAGAAPGGAGVSSGLIPKSVSGVRCRAGGGAAGTLDAVAGFVGAAIGGAPVVFSSFFGAAGMAFADKGPGGGGRKVGPLSDFTMLIEISRYPTPLSSKAPAGN